MFEIITGQKICKKLTILKNRINRFAQKSSITTECPYRLTVWMLVFSNLKLFCRNRFQCTNFRLLANPRFTPRSCNDHEFNATAQLRFCIILFSLNLTRIQRVSALIAGCGYVAL